MERHRINIKLLKYSKILFFLLVGFGCQHKQSISDRTFINFSIDTINIPIDEKYLGTYSESSVVNNDIFYGYNRKLRTIDVFDLIQKKCLKSIPLEKEGPNGVPLIDVFTVCDDIIIVDGRVDFFILNMEGEVIKKIHKKDLEVDKKYPGHTINVTKPVRFTNFLNLFLSCETEELFASIYSTKIQNIKDKYAGYCMISINLKTEDTELIPIPYPDIFLKNKFYGNLDEIQTTLKGDSLIYNFPNSSHIHIFNRQTKEITTSDIRSDYTKNISGTLDFNVTFPQIGDHYWNSLYFHKINYDPYRNQYYRLHADKCETNRIFDRDLYLVIMNDRFEKIHEIKIPSSFYPIYHVTKKGILFQSSLPLENEDNFSYMLLSFESDTAIDTANIPHVDIIENNDIVENREKIEIVINTVENNIADSQPSQVSDRQIQIPVENNIVDNQNKYAEFPLDEVISIDLLNTFVNRNLIYPQNALKEGVNGIVQVLIQFDASGIVIDHRMIYGCNNEEMENEAMRIIKLIKKVKTEKDGGFGFPIVFNSKKYLETHPKHLSLD